MSQINLRKQIQVRLEEKHKLSSARKGYFILLLVANSLIMLTFLGVSLLYNAHSISIPNDFLASFALLILLTVVIWKARSYVRQDDLLTVTVYIKVALIIVALVVLMLISGAYEIFGELETLHRFSFGALIIFLFFYTLNILFTVGALFAVLKKLKQYEIHSRNMVDINRLFVLSIFLFMALTLFVLLTGL